MAGMPGPHLDEKTEVLIRDYNIGGIILFSRNIEDPIQVARLCHDIQDASIKYHGVPVFLAVDQEGGRVARLREPFTQFPGNAAIGKDDLPVEKAIEFALTTAKEMRLVGLNMDFAPVVDVRRGEPEKHLKGRIFGEDPEKTALLGRTVVKTLQKNGVMAVAKHFPGLGRADLDPHLDLPRIELNKKDMEEVNLPPFRAVIDENVTGIMTSHAIYPALDPDLPGTLSPKILIRLLREEMGYKGLIITDDLEMGAIARQWGVAEGALAALEAGADILLICENQNNLLKSMNLIRTKLLKDEIPFQRLIDSHKRVVKARSKFLGRNEEIILEKVKEYFKLRI
jgi:beta-N-acetylhexosaminidase